MSLRPSADSLPGNESQGWRFRLSEPTLLTLDFVWVTGGFGQPSLLCVCASAVLHVCVCSNDRESEKDVKGDLVDSEVNMCIMAVN